MTKKLVALLFLVVPSLAHAQVPSLTSLVSTDQLSVLTSGIASALITRTLEPATDKNGFGGGFGLAAGVVAPTTFNSVIPNITSTLLMPAANPYVSFYAPLGISADFAWIPTLSFGAASFGTVGGNLRWAVTRILPDFIPISIATQATFTRGNLSYTQSISGIPTTIGFTSTIFGLEAIVSKSLPIIEPYVAAGFVFQTSTLSATSTTPTQLLAFLPASTSQSASVSLSGIHARAGLQIKLAVVVIGLEYENTWGNHAGNAKFGFKI